MEKLLVTDKELAQALGISLSVIRRDRLNGRLGIPFIKLGTMVRYDIARVKEWLAERGGARPQEPVEKIFPLRRGRGRPRKGAAS